MKKTTATQKKSKEVDTATEMPEQQKTREFKGKKIQRIAPAITSWTEEKVKERIKSELLSGQFGRGKVIPRFEREEERVHERIDENVQDELSDESLKKVTSVLRKMADTVVEFAEVMAEIGNTRTGGGIIKRTFENIAEMINGVSSSQPPQQQGLLDDDDIFNQPSFLDVVSALEQAFLQTRKNYAAQPEQPTTSQSQHHIQTPSFDLGVPFPQPAAMEQPQNKIDSTELRNIARDLDEDSEKTISDEQQLDTTPEDNTMKQLFDSEQLFEYAGYYLNRETFQSMRAGELESVIVDVWCLRLNQLDLNRGLDKPKRIFFSTQAFIFFGIYRHNHFYIMCYNFTTSMLEIIDNRPLPKGMSIQQKYADSPKVLNTAFSEYLMKRGHTSLAERIPKLPVELVKMKWRTADNKTDCGLYCMRHMETYMGNPQWKCGFTPKTPNDPYLASLRALYTSRILMMPVNVHKATVIRNAEEHFIGKRLLK
nr:uncharacterized protein LOC109179062 [Ipomoea batatas]